MRTARYLAPMILLALYAGGCASYPFQEGVKKYGGDVATELRTYVNKDATLDTATRADNLAAADNLQTATASDVTLQGVKSAWESARPRYTPYVDNDPLLDLDERAIRANNVARMDRLIDAEGKRFIYGGNPSGK